MACGISKFEECLHVAAQRVWTQLGPGHSEHMYERALEAEIRTSSPAHVVTSQFTMGVPYTTRHGHVFWLGSVAADLLVQLSLIHI